MNCECISCMQLPKLADVNPKCLVSELKEKCKSVLPGYHFGASYDSETKKSQLYFLQYMSCLNLEIDQIVRLKKFDYHISTIECRLIDYHPYEYGNEDCITPRFKIIIYVEKNID